MTEAVIVSTARTPIGKAYRGALQRHRRAPTLLGHAIEHAVKRARLDPAEIEDVVMGCALQQGSTGGNIARKALLRAGLPVTVAGTTIDRQCASGLQAIALAARSVLFDGVEIAVGGGGESISLVQNDKMNAFTRVDPALQAIKGDVYMAMIDTAEVVAKRYDIWRERQDEYSLESQRRTAAGAAGRQVQRRDRADHDQDGRRRQGHRRGLVQGRHAVAGRRPAARHLGRRSGRPEGGARRGLYHHRRQCQPALRRRLRRGDHERQDRGAEAA